MERIKANNARFKDANETIRVKADEVGAQMTVIPFLCECPVETCVEIVQLTYDEYVAIREHPDQYMTARGHEAAEGEVSEVVARHDGYVVVEKVK